MLNVFLAVLIARRPCCVGQDTGCCVPKIMDAAAQEAVTGEAAMRDGRGRTLVFARDVGAAQVISLCSSIVVYLWDYGDRLSSLLQEHLKSVKIRIALQNKTSDSLEVLHGDKVQIRGKTSSFAGGAPRAVRRGAGRAVVPPRRAARAARRRPGGRRQVGLGVGVTLTCQPSLTMLMLHCGVPYV